VTGRTIEVVVAGIGAVTPMGPTAADLWQGVREGRVEIRPMSGPGPTIGATVGGSTRTAHPYRRPGGHRERAIEFALSAADEAYAASGVGRVALPPERWGLVLGTCNAGLATAKSWYVERLRGGRPDPRMLLHVLPQSIAEALAGVYDIRGPVLSVNTACAAGANAIGYAAQLIRAGRTDAVLTGGTDVLSEVSFAGFMALEALASEPAAPYSRNRTGLSLGEGSGMLVLIREDLALDHRLPVLARILGYGLSADGYHPTSPPPDGEGAARAIRAALAAAAVDPRSVGYINGHGTGTPKNDSAETAAVRAALGAAADRVLMSSTKSQIGHLLGAAGAVEAIVTIQALENQIAPPTANFRQPDPECDIDCVPNAARPMRTDIAITNNFAFGGANAAVVIGREAAARPAGPNPDRVVVTGLAMLTSAGCDPGSVARAFASDTRTTSLEDGRRLGRVDVDPSPYLSVRDRRRMDRLGVFAVVAAKQALDDAGLEIKPENRARVGVIFGTGVGPMESMEAFVRPLIDEGLSAASPAIFPNTVYNAAAGLVAIHTGAVGPASTVTTGHAAGAAAIAYSHDLLAEGAADAIVCVAADALTATVIEAYAALGILGAVNPDFGLAEAGIALILERHSTAARRGARILGEIVGYGVASDGLGAGRFEPDGWGLGRAMTQALESAGRRVEDVREIWTGRSGHRSADAAETTAIARLFADAPKLNDAKILSGEPMGAGGALAAGLALLTGPGRSPSAAAPIDLVNSSSLGGTHIAIAIGGPP
jgi:3-oxoacyl-[acyl-carrier-protein] synthase II